MTGSGKRRKTKTGFPFVSPSPWKSLRDSRISTAPMTAVPFSESCSLAPFGRWRRANTHTKGAIRGTRKTPQFQAHPALESTRRFRLTPRWNQILISGSFVDWKMLFGTFPVEWTAIVRSSGAFCETKPIPWKCPGFIILAAFLGNEKTKPFLPGTLERHFCKTNPIGRTSFVDPTSAGMSAASSVKGKNEPILW